MSEYVKLLGAAIIGGGISVLTTIIIAWNSRKLEKIKIHSSHKFEALRGLILFATRMRNNSFPLAENKNRAFNGIMGQYSEEVLADSLYFNEETQAILDEFDEIFVCMNRGESASETNEEVNEFVENRLFTKSNELRELAKKQAVSLLL